MNASPAPIARTALLLADLQNDFIHPDGAYARAGQVAAEIAAVPARVKPLADLVRARGGWIVSTHFTLVPANGGEPLISPHLKELRPFLGRGDFEPGSWGHALVDALQPADLAVEKVAYSAFYMTRLDWVLRKCGIERLPMSATSTSPSSRMAAPPSRRRFIRRRSMRCDPSAAWRRSPPCSKNSPHDRATRAIFRESVSLRRRFHHTTPLQSRYTAGLNSRALHLKPTSPRPSPP